MFCWFRHKHNLVKMSEELYKLYRNGTDTKDEAFTIACDIAKPGMDPDEAQKRYDMWAFNYEKVSIAMLLIKQPLVVV